VSELDGQDVPVRDDWSARHWSPIAVAEHLAVRERAGLFDLTPLTRIEITGPGVEGFLAHVTAGRLDRGPGTVTYTVMLNRHGGVVSDVTLARFEPDRMVLGGNGPRDLAWLRHHLPTDGSVRLEPVTSERTCLGLWGHAAREILQPIAEADLSSAGFPYLAARRIQVAGIWVDAARISYAGELGWELSCGAAGGEALWAALWLAGRRFGMVAAGRAALGTLRLEKAYRAWGTDMTPQHSPIEVGLGSTLRPEGGFIGADALASRPPASHVLRSIVIDDDQVAMGGEPVLTGDDAVGFVTSAGYGPSVDQSLALAWLPAELGPNAWLSILYLDRRLPARIADQDPPFDAEGARLHA
jgi:glycine cleavage system aminomethyltransferase T